MRKISIFGDSISTFQGSIPEENRSYYGPDDPNGTGVSDPAQTWWMRVIDNLGGRLVANASFSGSTVDGVAFPAGRSMERAQQILGPTGEAPDTVLVFIGINDYGWGTVDAQMMAGSEAAPPRPDRWTVPEDLANGIIGNAPIGALQRFANAYDEMLENIRLVAPTAEVWCMTLLPGRIRGAQKSAFCHQLRGIDIDEYNKVIRMAAVANGCKVADIARFGFDYHATDGTHPDKEGMAQIAELTSAAIEGRLPDAKLFPPEMASTRFCERTSCIGCPSARSTGTQWSCVCEAHASR